MNSADSPIEEITPSVTLRVRDRLVRLAPGDLIGRGARAVLRIDSPSIAEHHAVVLARGFDLWLDALRGGLVRERRSVATLRLAVGERLALATEEIEVAAIQAPTRAAALVWGTFPPRVLQDATSLVVAPRLRTARGVVAGAAAVLWTDGARWHATIGAEAPRPLAAGDDLILPDGTRCRFTELAREEVLRGQTVDDAEPLRITVSASEVLVRHSSVAVEIQGMAARLIQELIEFQGPVSWELLAAELWPEGASPKQLRARFDMTLTRLRRHLVEAGILRELIVTSGRGHLELLLAPGDEVEHVPA